MLIAQNLNIRMKFFMLFLSLFALVSLFVSTASAYVGYRLLNIAAVQQEQSNWCWAASTEMVADYFGANATQTDIVRYVKGSVVNETGTVYDIQKGLSHYNISSTPVLSSLSFQTIVNQINNGQPQVAIIRWASGGGHAYVIRGYYEDTSASKQDVYYIDPWDASYNLMAYSSFVSNNSFSWVNSVHAIYVQ